MKSLSLSLTIVVLVFTLLTAPSPLAGQEHHHYKLISLGTFGGPESYIVGFEYGGPFNNLNESGMLTGWADTSMLDPYRKSSNAYGSFCFNGDCHTSHAFFWWDGLRFDLGTLPGGYSSAPAWISSNGLVAGVSQNGEFDPQEPGSPTNYPEVRAVLWGYGQIIDLGTLEGGYESGASAVNSRGQVVGWAINTVPDPNSLFFSGEEYNFYDPIEQYQTRAFLWQNGVMTDLGALGTGSDAWAQAINDKGQIVGISYTNTTVNTVGTGCGYQETLIPTEDPFFWEKGEMTDMGGLGGTCGQPYFLSNSGQVVGSSDLPGDLASHPFLWTKEEGMQDLGTLGGSSGSASMINDLGVVVGGTYLSGDSQLDAFLWDGKMHDLGALDGCSYAFAVNKQRQVVGNWGGAQCEEGAFLWENGGPMVDLSTLLTAPSDLVLGVVNNNDLGEIAGIGVDARGNGHAIVLVPCDGNHPNVEGCDYSMVDAAAAGVTGWKSSRTVGQGLSEQGSSIKPPSWLRPVGLSDPRMRRLGGMGIEVRQQPR
jgi:probable HAF family extracellular repeat protein